MLELARKSSSVVPRRKPKAKIGLLEMDRRWYQSVKRVIGSEFEIAAISLQDILFNNVDIGEYHSILVYGGIKYDGIDISATLDLITIIKNFSAKPLTLLLITDCADSQLTAEALSYRPQIDGVFAKDQDLTVLLKILKVTNK